jgi:hypothetical protein
MPRLTSLLVEWADLNEAAAGRAVTQTGANAGLQTLARGATPIDAESDEGSDPLSDVGADPLDLADALLRACEPFTDEMLRTLPATPDDAAASLANSPFADRVDGSYLPFEWVESFCSALRLPVADLEDGWDVSDGEDVYFCPSAELADDPDSPNDTRAFVRVDQITRWPEG